MLYQHFVVDTVIIETRDKARSLRVLNRLGAGMCISARATRQWDMLWLAFRALCIMSMLMRAARCTNCGEAPVSWLPTQKYSGYTWAHCVFRNFTLQVYHFMGNTYISPFYLPSDDKRLKRIVTRTLEKVALTIVSFIFNCTIPFNFVFYALLSFIILYSRQSQFKGLPLSGKCTHSVSTSLPSSNYRRLKVDFGQSDIGHNKAFSSTTNVSTLVQIPV